MTINEIIENNNIRSDRYAMAAISFIFKAFGDNIRSKEYWPWGRDVQCEWSSSKGTSNDILQAQQLLERAKTKYNEEHNSSTIDYVSEFKIESVENFSDISSIESFISSYKVKVNALHYYEKSDATKIYQLKENDYLLLSVNEHTFCIYVIKSINIQTNELVIDRLYGDYELTENSIYTLNPSMYFQIYIGENKKTNNDTMNNLDKQVKDLKRRLNKVTLGVKRINKASTQVIDVSEKTNDIVDSIKA